MKGLSRREILCGLAASQLLKAWQDPPKFTAAVQVVNVLATVRDRSGRIVATLTKDDFTIEEDGRPQVIQYFTRQFDSPLKLGLLIDTSGSETRNIAAERSASNKFLEQVMREQDKTCVIHFDSQVELLQDLSSSRAELSQALNNLTPADPLAQPKTRKERRPPRNFGAGGTLLYDAVYLAADEIMSKQPGRKAVILFSDGDDTGSKTTLASAIEAAQRADMLVYAVRFYDPRRFGRPTVGVGPIEYPRRRADGDEFGKEVLQRISSETGGAYFEASATGLDKVYARIQDELRNQYSLGYTSDQHGAGYRTLKVGVKSKALTAQARAGYYAK